MGGESPVPAPAGASGGLDVFSSVFEKINVGDVLKLSNGLAFLALLLAAILISMSMIRGNTKPQTISLIKYFLSVAVLFVVATVGFNVLQILSPAPTAVSLRIAPSRLQELGEQFPPLYVEHNGDEKDIFTTPYETTLSASRNFISVNAVRIADVLATRKRQISELTKSIELKARESGAAPTPGAPSDLEGP